jgi:hypothetical protein
MTTVLGFHLILIWCSGLFGCTAFDVAVSGSSLSDGAKYNETATLRPFAHPWATALQCVKLGTGVRGGHLHVTARLDLPTRRRCFMVGL